MILLDHPNIVKIIDFAIIPLDKFEGEIALVLELAEHGSLAEHVTQRGGVLPLTEVRDLISDCCQGLQYAHKKGVFHLDIKEQNILVFKNGERHVFKICDFGGSVFA